MCIRDSSCDVFLNERMKQQMLSGEQVTIGFNADEPVPVSYTHLTRSQQGLAT